MRTKQNPRGLSALEIGLILLCFLICLTGALLLPMDQCPDEAGRKMLSDWIYYKGTLPTGEEPATMLMSWVDWNAPTPTLRTDAEYDGWGFSYALRPYLSSILAALFMKTAALFTDSPRVLLAASRMCSVLSVTVCCFFCLRLGRRLFERRSSAILYAVLVCFLPQVMFLGMYQNNDALSLCAVSVMLYCFAEGVDRKWAVRSCVGLAVGISICMLSYYSAYGWILMCALFCPLAVLTDPEIQNKGRLILKRTALILGLCLLLAGWSFIRNALLHDGDFFGFRSELASRETMRAQGYLLHDYVCMRSEGMSILQFLRRNDYEWLRVTSRSFLGTFGYMALYLSLRQYTVYETLLCLGVLLCLAVLLRRRPDRRDGLLLLLMLCACAVGFAMHLWQSYARDYQPQGRYIITAVFPLGYGIAYGMDKTELSVRGTGEAGGVRLHPACALTLVWLLLFAWACLGTMTKMLA